MRESVASRATASDATRSAGRALGGYDCYDSIGATEQWSSVVDGSVVVPTAVHLPRSMSLMLWLQHVENVAILRAHGSASCPQKCPGVHHAR